MPKHKHDVLYTYVKGKVSLSCRCGVNLGRVDIASSKAIEIKHLAGIKE